MKKLLDSINWPIVTAIFTAGILYAKIDFMDQRIARIERLVEPHYGYHFKLDNKALNSYKEDAPELSL